METPSRCPFDLHVPHEAACAHARWLGLLVIWEHAA